MMVVENVAASQEVVVEQHFDVKQLHSDYDNE